MTLFQQANKAAAKAALEHVAQGDKEMNVEVTTDGSVEASINAPVKGFTVSAFVKAPIKTVKQAVAGFKVSKKFVLACLLVIPSPVYAQTATQVDRFTWGHTEAATVAQAFRFEIEIDGAAPIVLAGVTCTGAPTTCSARIPSVTPSQHVVRIRATDTTSATNPLVGPWSDPFTFTMRAVPSRPANITIIPGS